MSRTGRHEPARCRARDAPAARFPFAGARSAVLIRGTSLAQVLGVGGIIGKLSFDRDERLAQETLEQMLDRSRSPADNRRDVFTAPGIALGSCDAAGTEPHARAVGVNERETVRAVADASLTNAAALRAELERLGHRFRSQTVSELVAHAYEAWGPQGVAQLRGPFACAIWDGAARRLVIARDHVGIRQLYFAFLPNHGLVFASEIRMLLRDPGVGREWCPEALDAYLAVGYVPAPLTMYRRVSKLDAAHVLIVEGRRLRVEPYWTLPLPEPSGTGDERFATIDQGLRSAVRRHMRADTPGVLYSGGTASSALLAAAPRATGPVVTVSEEIEPGDSWRSDAAATHLGRTRTLESSASHVWPLASTLGAELEEPIADPAAIEQLALCLAARRHMDVALSGHGAGVLWAGYAPHHLERLGRAARGWNGRGWLARLTFGPTPAGDAQGYAFWEDERRRAIYTRGFAWHVRNANPFWSHLELYGTPEIPDPVERALYVEARTVLPDCLLPSIESAARAAGLRLRLPFLDRELVDRAARTPGALKQRGTKGMYALRRVVARSLPPRLMPPAPRPATRPGWLPTALTAMVPAVLLTPRVDSRGIVSRLALTQLWDEHRSGRGDHSYRLWALLMLEFWFRHFMDGDAAEQPLEYAVVKAA